MSTLASAPPASSSTPPNSAAAADGLTQEAAQDALLVGTDVGGGFAQTTSDAGTSPLPCTPNDPPLDQLVPPKVKAQTDFQNRRDRAAQRRDHGYADEATAERVLAAGEKGLACKTATIKTGGQTLRVTMQGPTDLTSSLKVAVDKCEGWQIKASTVEVVLIVARVGPQIVALTFTAATSVDKSTLPSTADVSEKALTKVKEAM